MGISDRCSYSLWFWLQSIALWAFWENAGPPWVIPMKVESVRVFWWFSWGGFLICVRYHQCMRFQFQVIFWGGFRICVGYHQCLWFQWQGYFIDYCCSRSIVADVFIRIFIDFSYFSACVDCSLWILIHIFTPVNVVVSLDWPELPHRKGVWKYKWLGAIPMVWCGICAVSTLRMCFYACRISLISGLLNEDLICWVGSWNCRGYSVIGICFRIFTGGCKQFCTGELVFRYLEFVFAGATFECSFCRVSESFVRLCVYVWCHSKGWRNLVVPEGFPLLCLLGFECFDTLPRMMKVPTESL